jgi:2-phosphosulfolactate phosphatase
MQIKILSGIKGAQSAKGITIIVDVLRAATVASYLLDAGIQSIIPVSSALELDKFNFFPIIKNSLIVRSYC